MAKKERLKLGEETGKEVGLTYKWVPGSSFPSLKTWEKENSEAVKIKVEKSLFADDTTLVGNKGEIDQGVEKTKEVMGWFEERNNDDKEERLDFGEEESKKIRMLGCWMGYKEDVDERLKRASKAWWKTRNRLKGAKFSKRLQARVVEACVESALLFDCHTRTWQVGELNRLQRFVDKAYRFVWSRKNKPPLIQMREEGKNMVDVRKELGIDSIRWKVEKRCLERIGHVMRMEDSRMCKAVVLGWMEELEKWDRGPGRTRKTVTYWRKLIREAGFDASEIGSLTADRKVWRMKCKERMDHLRDFEQSKGKKWVGAEVERNGIRVDIGIYDCSVCGKVCKSKAGLTIHKKRMHMESVLKKKFPCEKCGQEFKQEANVKNHKKRCTGQIGKVKCRKCGKEYSRSYLRKHERRCGVEPVEEEVAHVARVYKGLRGPCHLCGLVMAKTTIARHKREACTGR